MAKKIDTAAHLKKIENLRKQFYRDIEKGFHPVENNKQ
jgi:hypothetical protein